MLRQLWLPCDLVSEVVVHRRDVGPGPLADVAHAGAAEARLGDHLGRRFQEGFAGAGLGGGTFFGWGHIKHLFEILISNRCLNVKRGFGEWSPRAVVGRASPPGQLVLQKRR